MLHLKKLKMTHFKHKIVLLALASTIFTACKDNVKKVQPTENENEVITTVIINLTDSVDASKVISLKYKDLNPNDINEGVFTIPNLDDNKTYFGELVLLDESKADIDTVSNDIAKEADDHQFVYKTSDPNFIVNYVASDVDSKGYFVGLKPKITTKNLGGKSVNLQITLYHLPDIKKADINENIKNGSTDLDIIFSVIKINSNLK